MKDKPPVIISAGVLAQLSIAMVTAMVVPLLVGIALSRYFNLGPLAVVCAMGFGVLLGSLAVYRIVKSAYEQLGGGK
jgi:F0F1-type ATP synthase assembly protein I